MSLATISAIIGTIIFGLVFLIAFFSFIRSRVWKGKSQDEEFDYDSLPQKKPSGTVNIHPKKNKAIYTSGILKQSAITSRTLYPLGDGPENETNIKPDTKRLKFEVINKAGSENRKTASNPGG
ncbi:MAG: hypothetical protein AB9882_06935 [Ignavibacteriaceae bacterium]